MAPPAKKRKVNTTAVEEVNFDPDARKEFLTGFHKRKLQRTKNAQEVAERRAKEEKRETRRKVRFCYFPTSFFEGFLVANIWIVSFAMIGRRTSRKW